MSHYLAQSLPACLHQSHARGLLKERFISVAKYRSNKVGGLRPQMELFRRRMDARGRVHCLFVLFTS